MAAIRFYFDYISPYAYIAWTQIGTLAARHGYTVEPVPILFAALLNAGGQKGPAEIPAKRIWVWKDTLRTARKLGVPLVPPPAHPFNPLLALRVTTVVATGNDNAAQRRLIDALYRETWGGGAGIESAAAIERIVTEVGLDGPAILSAAAEAPAKTRLRQVTDEAIAANVFGVPSMRVISDERDELFWGYDSFGHLEDHLRGQDPFSPDDLTRWQNLPSSASRT